MNIPSRYKLTGDAKRLWEILTAEYEPVLRDRHLPLLFALCQQWEVYLISYRDWKAADRGNERYKASNQMTSALKQFNQISSKFAMGINDQLEFSLPAMPGDATKKEEKHQSRLGALLSRVGASSN